MLQKQILELFEMFAVDVVHVVAVVAVLSGSNESVLNRIPERTGRIVRINLRHQWNNLREPEINTKKINIFYLKQLLLKRNTDGSCFEHFLSMEFLKYFFLFPVFAYFPLFASRNRTQDLSVVSLLP